MSLARVPYGAAIAVAILVSVAAASARSAAPSRSGEAIYREDCAACHGAAGQGGDGHERPLAGDLPPVELARVIADTMPEGDPEACVGDDAIAVAEYVHEAFYSVFARARNRPPRRSLSRLTVRQVQQTLADLLDPRQRLEFPPERGIRASFMRKVNTGRVGETEERTLPRLALTLSEYEGLPDAFRDLDAVGPEQFGNKRIDVHARMWAGLYAPRSGVYELIVKTRNGFELRLNHRVLIDARVRSDDEPELRAAARLVGGRVYSIGFNTSRINEEDLRFQLRWIPPGGVEEPIPARWLTPNRIPPVHAVASRFPPDDRSAGYLSAARVSSAWHEAVTAAALETADRVVGDLPRYAKSGDGELKREQALACGERLVERAFRRPLSEEERDSFLHAMFGDDVAPVESLRAALLAALTSPRFLYPELGAAAADAGDGYRVASRVALAMWDSLPDRALRSAAGRGGLASRAAVREHAERMLGDLRTRSKLDRFFEHWLLMDRHATLSRDRMAFPDFDDRVAADMRASLERMIDDVVWHGDGDLRRLFLTDELYVNRRLARFLGMDDLAEADGFVLAPGDHEERVGIVTHPFLVGALAYHRETSPIHRGVFLARHVLGRSLRPPPEAVAPLAPELAPELTTRERVVTQTQPAQCQTCHVLINNLGFPLEHFDAVGRFRETDAGRPIDATGGYVSTAGADARLSGARELATYLAESPDVHRSFVVQLFEHMTNQPIAAYGIETEHALLERFRDSGFNIRELLVDIAVAAALADEA